MTGSADREFYHSENLVSCGGLDIHERMWVPDSLSAGDDSCPHQADNVGLEKFEVYVTFTVSR